MHMELNNNGNNNDLIDTDIDVEFGNNYSSDSDTDTGNKNLSSSNNANKDESKQENLANYTIIDGDHLSEDPPIRGQEYCLLSFMSPEGIMNCNVRAVKFRGAFPTLEAAEIHANKLEKEDEYFQIFAGESGKWLDFDPPTSKVEKEKSSNPQHQKILDAQHKHRMDKINELAGKTKQMRDKNKQGKKEMINEKKKAAAAQEISDKKREKKKQTENDDTKCQPRKHRRNIDATYERMRKKLAERQNKQRLQNLKLNEVENTDNNEVDLETKIKVVNKNIAEIEEKKIKLDMAEKNIEKIKALMEKRKK